MSPAKYDANNNSPNPDKQIYYIHDASNCESVNSTDHQSSKEDSVKLEKSLWTLPKGTWLKRLWWLYTWPIKLILTLTIPNPKTFKRLYPLTFALCVVWIGANSYLIVWMITVVGKFALLRQKPIKIDFFKQRSYLLNTRVRDGTNIISCWRLYARSYLECPDDS